MKTARKLFIAAVTLVSASGLCSAQTSSPASARSPASSTSTTSSSTTSSSTSPGTTTSSSPSSATTTAPYTEGSVWQITMVRSKTGMTDDYLKNLAKNYKTVMEEEKRQNLVVSYKILLGDASSAEDYNLLLMVEYKNMAALDGLRDKTDPITQKLMGGTDQIRDASVKRAEVRDILGSKTMREITLK